MGRLITLFRFNLIFIDRLVDSDTILVICPLVHEATASYCWDSSLTCRRISMATGRVSQL